MRFPFSRPSILTLCLATALVAGCSKEATPPTATGDAGKPAATEPAAVKAVAETDEHSYAEPDKVRTKDLALWLNVDFDKKELSGSATLSLDWLDPKASQLVLDSRDLTIEKVVGERSDGIWEDLKFSLAEADPLLGSKLVVEVPQRNPRVRITYRTSPSASGLQWLTPAMTEGKKTPFMFSQSQQIHARSWVPLQDTPRVRFTYTAKVTSPKDAMVLMSADNDPKAARDGDYEFKMPQPIPSYLLAIAAGDLVFQPISERSGVWAEPSMAGKAATEFSDAEKMMQATEKLYGPYRWGRYDILVLPPSFPYGGMENPRLTFATPTVIVGDKSLVSLVAHELAHSWSGNLVTFSSAKDAWLNEGFTSYVENRIIEDLYGKERADMENVIGRNELAAEYAEIPAAMQVMALKPGVLKDPDDSSTATVYTKGAWLLQFLEQSYGREVFDPFLKGYFDHFAFQSIPTAKFVDYLKANLLDKHPGKVTLAQVEQWVYEPGIPDFAPKTVSPRFDAVDAARKAWLDAGTLPAATLTSGWTTQEWVHFVGGLPERLETTQLTALDAAYKFTGTPNGEIAQRWYPLTVRSGYTPANAAIAAFLQKIGRRKLIMPTYEELVKTPEGLKLAEDTFAKARPGYHPITTGTVEAVIAKAKAGGTKPAP
ncbi:M1 family metallopeptidase [Montanilutibacter psychrotolerans]|uniref:Aminopeptidase N n=1 Tax=Montanilutibacter psychrotolerans TaxID=1327343 RepID=A0A3M8SNG1_9GAMM|nr:M1 family metallopeptidase [Lysobacter psychrotolerans]RNF82837.1 M1 family peptidase [Lysobacter psychrotolerans]